MQLQQCKRHYDSLRTKHEFLSYQFCDTDICMTKDYNFLSWKYEAYFAITICNTLCFLKGPCSVSSERKCTMHCCNCKVCCVVCHNEQSLNVCKVIVESTITFIRIHYFTIVNYCEIYAKLSLSQR